MDFDGFVPIVGLFLPLVISLVKRADWSTQTKRVVAAVVSVAAAAASYLIEHGGWVGWAVLIEDVAVIYALAQVAYLGFWEGTRIERAATRLLAPAA